MTWHCGYLDNNYAYLEHFTNEGYFRTGDQGRSDDAGYLTLTGGLKEFFNKGDGKISPLHLDNIICTHESVQEVVCFAIDDKRYGQDVG
jgi:acyl-CoA synthetase (AMP-forming)/AMP-acid ligase II